MLSTKHSLPCLAFTRREANYPKAQYSKGVPRNFPKGGLPGDLPRAHPDISQRPSNVGAHPQTKRAGRGKFEAAKWAFAASSASKHRFPRGAAFQCSTMASDFSTELLRMYYGEPKHPPPMQTRATHSNSNLRFPQTNLRTALPVQPDVQVAELRTR